MSALCGWVRYCCCAESRPSARRVPVVETFTGTWLTIFLAIFSHKTCQTKRFNGVKDNQFSHSRENSQMFHYMKSRSFWTTTLNGSFTRRRRVFVQWIYYMRLMGITTTLFIILAVCLKVACSRPKCGTFAQLKMLFNPYSIHINKYFEVCIKTYMYTLLVNELL